MRPALTALALAAVLGAAACAGQEAAEPPAAGTSAGSPAAGSTVAQPAPASSAPPASSAAAPPGSAAATTSAPAEPDVQTVELEVADGRVSGDTGRVEVPLGSTFRLVVTSDVADEVHVHGYDQPLALTPGVPAEVEVEATLAGVYEVELHDAGTLLTRIAVS